jgi:hypothetical protein
MNDEEFVAGLAKALVLVLGGVKRHELADMTGIADDDVEFVFNVHQAASLYLESIK